MSVLLTIDALRVETLSGAPIVDGVSFELRRGEVLGLIGESGAGKSTIGLASLGYARPGCRIAGGRIVLDGRDLRALDPEGRRRVRGSRVAYVAQSAAASFDPAMTLLNQVAETAIRARVLARRDAEQRARDLFRELDLPEPERFGARYPHQASGGQLQRAMAAMAMTCRPEMLVLDEPTTALDVTTQIEVLAQLRSLIRQHGTAALYISHDLAVVGQIADRIMVLRHGRMVEEGAASAILTGPRTDYAKALVAERRGGPSLAQSAAAEPLLQVDGLTVRYGAVRAVESVDLTLRRGETVAVVGESGSGKSTVANAILGVARPAAGTVRLAGEVLPPDYRARSREHRRAVQMVHQIPDVALNPRQSVRDIIQRPMDFFGRHGTGVDAWLAMVGLAPDMATRRPGQLSGGQKQRACIARALAAEPAVLICDEVTSALDPLVAEGILALLHDLQSRLGISCLFITHDLGTVRRVAHRVAVMWRGRVVESGAAQEVLAAPSEAYTQRLLASVPEMRPGWLDEALRRRPPRAQAAEPTGSGGDEPSPLDEVALDPLRPSPLADD